MSALLADPERRKLAWSLAANFVTRLPSVLLPLILLPRLYGALGAQGYASLFAALALGGLGVFLTGGAAVLGMREIGAAASQGDRKREADAFASLAVANLLLSVVLILLAGSVELALGQGPIVALIATLPLVQAGMTTVFDNCRLAYNEHYWAASLSLVFQLIVYSMALGIPGFLANPLLAATIFHAPITLGAAVNAVLLWRARPYLWRGRPTRLAATLRAAASFGTADGVLTASLGLSLIWLQQSAAPETASWFATQSRLFQMSLTPIMTVMVPLAGFLRLRWIGKSRDQQRDVVRRAFSAGALSAATLTLGLGVGGPLYAALMLRLPPPASLVWLAPIFLLFGTIGFYRVYASIANLLLDGERLALGVIAANGAAALACLAFAAILAPLEVFALYAALASILMLALLLASRRTALARPVAIADRIEILGVPVSVTDHSRAARSVFDAIGARRSFLVCVRDVHGLMLARRDAALAAIHRDADLVLPDGMPIVHVARLRGHRTIARVAGPDFVDTLADLGRRHGIRHYFHGGMPGTAERMAASLTARHPGMTVAGCSTPPLDDKAEDAATIEHIRATRPDILWVGLSTPKQEHWMRRHRDALPGVTLIGVGAAFDFHAGIRRRAPRWMQRATLEWLHRLLSEPRRLWRRYLLLAPRFAWLVLWERAS